MTNTEKFASNLIKLREENNMTQEQFAKKIGITRQSLSLYEKAERTINIDVLTTITKKFDVSADYLLGLSEVRSVDSNIKVACEVTGLSEKSIDNIKNGCFPSEEVYNKELVFIMLNSLLSSAEILDIIAAMCDISSIEINNYKDFDIWNDSLHVAFEKLRSNSFEQDNALYDDIKAKKDEVTVRKYQIEENFKKLYLSAIENFKNSDNPEEYFKFKSPLINTPKHKKSCTKQCN